MAHSTESTVKLDEALAQLNEAVRERRDEVNKLIAEKYGHLKAALGDAAGASSEWVKEQTREVGDKAKQAASTVDKSVHEHPWYYIGGVAVGALVLGFLLGRQR